MTATYNPAEVERLVREAREDDDAMDVSRPFCPCPTADLIVEGHDENCPAEPVDAALEKAQRRIRRNLRAMADQLEAARAEIDRVQRVNNLAFGAARDQHVVEVGRLKALNATLARQSREQDAVLVARIAELEGEVERLRPIVEAVAGAAVDR